MQAGQMDQEWMGDGCRGEGGGTENPKVCHEVYNATDFLEKAHWSKPDAQAKGKLFHDGHRASGHMMDTWTQGFLPLCPERTLP